MRAKPASRKHVQERITLTDSVTELIDLGRSLRSFSTSEPSPTVFDVLKKYMRLETEYDVLFATNIIYNRCFKTWDVISTLRSEYVTQRLLSICQESLLRFMSFFSATNINEKWSAAVKNHLSDVILDDMSVCVPFLRERMPLRKISPRMRSTLLKQIDDLLTNIQAEKELPAWARTVFVSALIDLQFSIKNLPFVGIEETINNLTVISSRSHTLWDSLDKKDKNTYKSALRIIETLVVVGHALCLPAELNDSARTYNNWLTGPLHSESSPKLLLSAPIQSKASLAAAQATSNKKGEHPSGLAEK